MKRRVAGVIRQMIRDGNTNITFVDISHEDSDEARELMRAYMDVCNADKEPPEGIDNLIIPIDMKDSKDLNIGDYVGVKLIKEVARGAGDVTLMVTKLHE